jgi:hypothetical protein
MTPRGYIDTCIVSAITREQFPEEKAAMLRLLDWHERGVFPLVTSDIMHHEIMKIPERHRANRADQERLYSLLLKVPSLVPVTRLTAMGVPGASLESFTLRALERFIPDRADARHVFAALYSGIEFFVTTDYDTILRHRDRLKTEFRVTALFPSELVAVLLAEGLM